MPISLRSAALPALILAVALPLFATAPASAGSISSVPSFGFTTSGQIGSSGITGFNSISYQSQADPIWGTTGSRYLGKFLVGPLPEGLSTTYADTPFSISVLPAALQVNDTWYKDGLQPIVLTGRLNGMITGTSYSNVVASFDPVSPWVDIVKGGVPDNQTFLAGTGPFLIKAGGTTDATMNWSLIPTSASPVPVPEPTAFMVIASGLTIGLVARRRKANRFNA
ncbi:MAG: hypothetical protein ACKO5E_08300 [bacterium]